MDVVVERFKTNAATDGRSGVAQEMGVLERPHERPVSASSTPEANGLLGGERPRGGEGATRLAVLFGDLLALVLVTTITWVITAWLGLHPAPWVLAILCAGLGALYLLAGFYHRLVVHPATEIRDMMRITAFVVLGIFVGLGVGGVAETDIVVGLFGLIALVVVPLARALLRVLAARTTWWGIPVVVISYNDAGQGIVDGLRRWPEMGLRPVALFEQSDTSSEPTANGKDPDMIVGEPRDAARVAAALGVRDTIVSFLPEANEQNADKMRYYAKMFRRVYELREGSRDTAFWTALPVCERFAGVYLANAHASHGGYRLLKRVLDVVISFVVGIVLLPVLLVTSLLIRLDSSGPALFKQLRMGRAGRIYSVYKFRTMHPSSEERLAEILANDEQRKKEYVDFHKLSDDPRITRVGSFLRRYSLDELPQFWNVFVGDMSLVGPRAYVPGEISDMAGLERVVLQVRPGITGLWQVLGRNEINFQTRVELDIEYVQNATLWLDLYIMVRTFPVVLTGQGAG